MVLNLVTGMISCLLYIHHSINRQMVAFMDHTEVKKSTSRPKFPQNIESRSYCICSNKGFSRPSLTNSFSLLLSLFREAAASLD